MATTKAKESCGLGKERKITTPNSVTVPNTPTKRTPKSSPRAISHDQKLSSSASFSSSSAPSLSTLAEKHVPNYLKSTASSRHEHSSFKPIKKPAAGPAPIPEGKPSLNRRRSFDKPPPAAPRLDKPFRSPGPRNRATHVPVRSSSFGAKPTTSTIVSSAAAKPGLLERTSSKISKVGGGKPQQPVQILRSSSNVKKNLKRQSSNAAVSASASSAEIVPKTRNAVEHVDDQTPSFVLGVNEEELKKIECELDPYLPDPMPKLDKEVRIDQVEKKAGLDKEEAEQKIQHHHQQPIIQDTDISKAVASDKEVEESPRAAETDIISIDQADAKSSTREEENREKHEGEGEEEEEGKEEEKPERISVEKEEVASEESTHKKNEAKSESESESETDPIREGVVVSDEKEAQDGERSSKEENDNSTPKEETPEKEAEMVADKAAEKEAEMAAEKAAGKARQGGGGQGKKESPAMYNDVIEETASKLLEKRKNKVRALAGAFQTVIDYESSSK